VRRVVRTRLALHLRSALTAAAAPPPALAHSFALRALLLLLLRGTLLRLLLAGTLLLGALLFLLLTALAVPRLLLLAVFLACPARFLFELADLFLHETARLCVLTNAQLAVPAIGAALPTLGIGLPAGTAKNAFRQRHREIGAHCTLRAVDETRRQAILALIHMAGESSPNACWDDQRAMDLLRRQATPEELRELGVEESLVAHIFAEEHAG
jgi:hypothetical protein